MKYILYATLGVLLAVFIIMWYLERKNGKTTKQMLQEAQDKIDSMVSTSQPVINPVRVVNMSTNTTSETPMTAANS